MSSATDLIDQLNRHMKIDGALDFDIGPGGFTRANLKAHGATARVMLHGAHLAGYRPAGGEPVLFMSEHTRFEKGAAIRGGVPLCFPWFAERAGEAGPKHGFARILPWTCTRTVLEDDGRVRLMLTLRASEKTRRHWPHAFEAVFMLTLGAHLKLSFGVRNLDTEPITFEEAFHPYFAVHEVRETTLSGLGGQTYRDRLEEGAPGTERPAGPDLTRPIDRIYTGTRPRCVLTDPRLRRRIRIEKIGAADTVVWNPGSKRSRAIEDLGDEEWPGFLCVEPANIGEHAVTLEPGKFHEMQMIVTPEA